MDAAHRDTGLERGTYRQFKDGAWRNLEDVVSPEIPVLLHWPGAPPKRLWAFPHETATLALGHMLLDVCRPGQVPELVERAGEHEYRLAPAQAPPERSPAAPFPPLEPQDLLRHMAAFIEAGGRWDMTGCFHRAGVLDPAAGVFLHQVEDIGRHNCIDRVAGWCLAQGLDPAGLALFVSARVTASLAGKIARAGFPFVMSRSAVTTAGIAAAQDAGMTLLGFSRVVRFTVFHDPEGRVLDNG
jgi:FdhD protein